MHKIWSESTSDDHHCHNYPYVEGQAIRNTSVTIQTSQFLKLVIGDCTWLSYSTQPGRMYDTAKSGRHYAIGDDQLQLYKQYWISALRVEFRGQKVKG